MGTLQEEVAFFNNLYPAFRNGIQHFLNVETTHLRDIIAKDTPSSSGELSRAWRVNKTRGVDVIASSSVHNPLAYAPAIELGVSMAEHPNHPWVKSIKNKTSDGVVLSKGRVWSAKKIGGTMLNVFTPAYHQKLTRRLATEAVKVFK